MASFQSTLIALGAFTAAYLLLRVSRFIATYIRPSQLPRYLHSPKGSWALITGASDGIGQGFAQELCMRGFNVVIHGRNLTKLEKVKAGLLKDHPERSIRIVTLDASRASPVDVENLVASVSDLPITVQINNVGGVGGILRLPFETLASHTGEQINGLVGLNALFATQVTRAMIPDLSRRAPALILNVGSLATVGIPYLSVYSGVKGYLRAWSYALAAEMKGEDLDIEVLCMQVGETISAQIAGSPRLFVPSSRTLARAALERVGCGKTEVAPYLPHALQAFGIECLPEQWRQKALLREVRSQRVDEKKGL